MLLFRKKGILVSDLIPALIIRIDGFQIIFQKLALLELLLVGI